MKEFDISDKELKSLLHSEGFEEPAPDFNQSVLSKIEAFEKEKATPVKAPKWILLLLAFLFVAPSVYFIFFGDPSVFEGERINIPVLNTGISTKFMIILIFAILATGMALIFNRMLQQQSREKSQVKKG